MKKRPITFLAGGSATIMGLVLLSQVQPHVSAADPSWKRPANQNAARAVNTTPEIAADDPRGGKTSASRAQAMTQLRSRLGASDRLPIESQKNPDAARGANLVMHNVDPHGRVAGLWALRSGGLRERFGQTADATFRQFVIENVALYDLQGSDALTGADLDWLAFPETVRSADVRGKSVERIVYTQNYRGHKVLDGDVVASFFDGHLISVTGAIINPAFDLVNVDSLIDVAAGERAAFAALATRYPAVRYTISRKESGVLMGSAVAVHRFVADPTGGSDGEGQVVAISAKDGTLVGMSGAHPGAGNTSVNYRTYAPLATDPDTVQTNAANQSDRAANGWDDGLIEPWYFQSVTYATGVYAFTPSVMSGGQLSTFTQPIASPNFLANPGTAQFNEQQAAYWAQQARPNFFWVAPPAVTATFGVKILQGITGTGDWFQVSGCENVTPDYLDDEWCVRLGNNSGWRYPNGAPQLSAIWHEMGHFTDQKYTGFSVRFNNLYDTPCGDQAGEESKSVTEGIGMATALNMWLTYYGTGTTFAPYTVNMFNLGAGGPVSHDNDSDVQCYRQPGTAYCNQHYLFAGTFLQAFWESAWGRNCDTACWIMNDGATAFDSMTALNYASANTPASGDFVSLVGNYLTWYYYNKGDPAWSNRWWVFNHHRLVGPVYGYSPCDLYTPAPP